MIDFPMCGEAASASRPVRLAPLRPDDGEARAAASFSAETHKPGVVFEIPAAFAIFPTANPGHSRRKRSSAAGSPARTRRSPESQKPTSLACGSASPQIPGNAGSPARARKRAAAARPTRTESCPMKLMRSGCLSPEQTAADDSHHHAASYLSRSNASREQQQQAAEWRCWRRKQRRCRQEARSLDFTVTVARQAWWC